MNTQLLLALGLAVVIGLVVVALLLRGRRQAPPARPAMPPAAAPAPLADATPARPAGAVPDAAAAQLEAQRQAATEALRLARQRKAEEAARLDAERAAQARAEAAARADAAARAEAAARAQAAARADALVRAEAAARADATARAEAAARAQPRPPVAAPVPAAALRPPVVLLADDSKVVRVKTGRLLEKQGWRVLLAEDGAAAVQALVTESPDLLITDVEMPEIDGFELTRRVRAHPRFSHLPVIMITSSDERHRAEAQAAGVNLLLGKPYAEETLLAQVQALLAAHLRQAGSGLAVH